jgi:hypothetical protein
LDAGGEYLALTRPNGSILQSFDPYPSQRENVSYGVDYISYPLSFIPEGTAAKADIPVDNRWGTAWRGGNEPFDDSTWIQGTNGFGFSAGTTGVPGETNGYPLINRSTLDGASGSAFVLPNMPFTKEGSVLSWRFFSDDSSAVGRLITPLIFKKVGDNYKIMGIGQTRTNAGTGLQSFDFGLVSGSAAVEDSDYYFGYKDGDNSTDNTGVIEHDQNTSDIIIWFGGDKAGQILVGEELQTDLTLGRTYSIEVTTGVEFGSEITTDLESKMYSHNASCYMRNAFEVTNLTAISTLSLSVRYEDGFVAYLNGTEVARRNFSGTPAWNSTASSNRSESDAMNWESIDLTSQIGLLQTGSNMLSIQGLNDAANNSFFLTDLQLSGEEQTNPQDLYFTTPTPGAENNAGVAGFVADTKFSVDRGFYSSPTNLTITCATAGATIYCITNGSVPAAENADAFVYSTPISLDHTMVLRVAAYKPDWQPSNVDTHSYIFVADVPQQSEMWTGITQDATWGPQLTNALTILPTISIVTDGNLQAEVEKPISIEMINPDGSPGFQLNAGAEYYGGHSLTFPKKSMRISFRKEYGAGKLHFDIFADGGVNDFDQILLRTGSHDSLFYTQDGSPYGEWGVYIRNRWIFDRQLEMGQPAPRGRFVQVYLNGVYWGQHQLMERPEASFMASYFGGKPEDYDALNKGIAIDGDLNAWNAMKASTGDYATLQNYMDVTNYADYMLLEFYGGNDWDWRINQNWMAARKRETGAGFKFFAWDSDIVLRRDPSANVIGKGGPGDMWGNVRTHAEFKMLMADRAQKIFFDGGMLTPSRVANDFDALANQIQTSIIAECARWGDKTDSWAENQDYTPTSWQTELNELKQNYFPNRTATVIQQLRDAGLLPATQAPAAFIDGTPSTGGIVADGATLTLSNPNSSGTLYYTLDGSDPRLPGGSVSPNALEYNDTSTTETLVPSGSIWHYLDNGTDQGTTWRAETFDDSSWASGNAQLGYGDSDEATVVSYGSDSNNKYITTYFRRAFSVTNVSGLQTLTLRLLRDDGAVVYLNGTEVVRNNMPSGSITYLTTSPPAVGGADENTWYEYSIPVSSLHNGTNVLAVEIHQHAATSSDISFDLKLEATRTTSSAPSIVLNQSTRLLARVLNASEWSPLRDALFSIPTPISTNNLILSELHYHPTPPTATELAINPAWSSADFEFLELHNTSVYLLDLGGLEFISGITLTFPTPCLLQPNERIVVVRNLEAFQTRYGTGRRIAGEYIGKLSDSGEHLRLQTAAGATIFDFSYSDNFTDFADGLGPAMVFLGGIYSEKENWRDSTYLGGTPAQAPVAPKHDLIINEVLTHTDLPQSDSIEILNTSTNPINIGGWWLSDSSSNPQKFALPAGLVLQPSEYAVFNEDDFNPNPLNPAPNDFSLSGAHGDEVWLYEADTSGKPVRIADTVSFPAAPNGESFGRCPNATGDLYPMKSLTLGAENSAPRVGPIILSEIMYDYPGDTNGLLEFVEIYNPAPTNRPLDHWQLLKGINFAFPNGILLPATGTVVLVNFDPQTDPTALANFRAAYNIGTEVPLYGPFSGRLDNNGETLRLSSPDAPPTDDPTFYPALIEDETRYAITPPWPQTPAGGGDSLNRLNPEQWGYDPLGWYASAPTPGTYQPPPREGFVQWHRNAFPYETPAEDRAWSADPDANGLPNGYAYAFGFDPTSGTHPPSIFSSIEPSGETLEICYLRRKNVEDLAYGVSISGDLASWVDASNYTTPINTTPAEDGIREKAIIRIQLSAPAFSNGCGFVRILADPR